MSKYKYKEDFKECFLEASDYPGTTEEAQDIRLNELDEVYAKAEALIKASKDIVQLQAEKRDLTDALNRVSRPVGREDANWDSRPRERSRGSCDHPTHFRHRVVEHTADTVVCFDDDGH